MADAITTSIHTLAYYNKYRKVATQQILMAKEADIKCKCSTSISKKRDRRVQMQTGKQLIKGQ